MATEAIASVTVTVRYQETRPKCKIEISLVLVWVHGTLPLGWTLKYPITSSPVHQYP